MHTRQRQLAHPRPLFHWHKHEGTVYYDAADLAKFVHHTLPHALGIGQVSQHGVPQDGCEGYDVTAHVDYADCGRPYIRIRPTPDNKEGILELAPAEARVLAEQLVQYAEICETAYPKAIIQILEGANPVPERVAAGSHADPELDEIFESIGA